MEHQKQAATGPIQLLLAQYYRGLIDNGHSLPSLGDIGFKCSSQADEDGILLFLFAIIGTGSKTCIEMCAGDGRECNTANLILNHGWTGLLVDGSEHNVKSGQQYYGHLPQTYIYPPKFVQSWLTLGNVNQVIEDHGFTGEVDLLSIDVDGVDYWLWDAINVVTPRVVVVEYQDILGPNLSLTVPYSDEFSAKSFPTTEGLPNFAGASLTAFVRLGRSKGYRLVGVNRYGYNAFFIRKDLAPRTLPEIDVQTCFHHPKVQWGMKHRYPLVKDLPWVVV